MKYTLLLISIFLTTCGDNEDDLVICTEQFVYGLNVTVKDVATNVIITEDIIVVAKDGNYEETLMNFEGFDHFIGAGEREGNYTIEVRSNSYLDFTSEVIQVGADECHVIPETVEILLLPN